MRKIEAAAKLRATQKIQIRKKTRKRQPRKTPKKTPAKKNARTRKSTQIPEIAGMRPPPPGHGKRGEKGHFGYLLRQAQAAARLTLERSLAELGATPPQFMVLTMLKAYPGLSGADLARIALLTPQTVGVIIRNLERDGAIRKAPHPVYGRVLQWTLTPRGLTLLEHCRRRAIALDRRLVAGLGTKAEGTVRRWLSKIAVSLHQES
jgi:DNA-binding MarR family transcriptional regulator